jgi:hypothetical protein
MSDLDALRAAVYLFHLPSAVRAQREKPLPEGMQALLEVAADETNAAAAAAARLERPTDVVREACAFFIEQILLAPEADAYRVLGVSRDASDIELRRHRALILRWVHPDMDRAGDRSVYAGRVTGAWEALKSSERRAAYDVAHPPRGAATSRFGNRKRQRGVPTRTRGAAAQLAKLTRPQERPPGLIGSALRFLFRRPRP